MNWYPVAVVVQIHTVTLIVLFFLSLWFEHNSLIQFRDKILNAHSFLKSFFLFSFANQSAFCSLSDLLTLLFKLFLFYLFISQGVISVLRSYIGARFAAGFCFWNI